VLLCVPAEGSLRAAKPLVRADHLDERAVLCDVFLQRQPRHGLPTVPTRNHSCLTALLLMNLQTHNKHSFSQQEREKKKKKRKKRKKM